MAYRKKMSRKSSRRDFSHKARRVHNKNDARPMRGGIRM